MKLNTDMSKSMFMTVTCIIAILSLLVFSNAFAITDRSTTPKTDKDNKDKDNKPAADEDGKDTIDNAPDHRDDHKRSDGSSVKKDKTPFVLAEPVPFP
jgi:hypothetical protein